MTRSSALARPFTQPLSELPPIAESLDSNKNDLGLKIANILRRERESERRRAELNAQLDIAFTHFGLKEGTTVVRPELRTNLPTVTAIVGTDDEPEISYQIGPNHKTPPQALVFRRRSEDSSYTMSLNHYKGGEIVSTPVLFDDLSAQQQETILSMATVLNTQFATTPNNFNLAHAPNRA